MIQMFIHYLPSFYHLHVHIVSHGLNIGNFVGKAHNIEDVIDNIKMDSEYYQKKSIVLNISDRLPFYAEIKGLVPDLPDVSQNEDIERFESRFK
mmetsp:Transcript_21889/g.3634  ORF Transcript_21889/g.3634 Transcript_21889/m.3634 type:complete len:94 (-) Transcript_21889:13-294(-)